MSSDYFSVHSHVSLSVMDGMGTVADHVARVADLGQPAFTLSDHGTMAGTVQAYKECAKAGLGFFPGTEFYVVRDVWDKDTRGERWHLGMIALDYTGYQALVRLHTLSWREDRFYYKPLIDLSDLAFLHDQGLSDHLAITTGCHSGLVIDQWKDADPVRHARAMTRMLAAWFPHTYVELQNHGITWEDGHTDMDVASALYGIAHDLGLPVVIGGDSHYVHAHQQPTHDLMKDICYFGDGEDLHFKGGPYHLLSSKEAMHLFPKRMRDALEAGHGDLLDRHRVSIPPLDNYRFNVPKMFADPDTELETQVWAGMAKRGLQDLPSLGRAADELKVIKAMGFANYHLLVKAHITDWCRAQGIIVNLRGSGNGAMVNYALGISEVNPLLWNTSFDRYLSLDRMKPPDLDIDVDFRGRARLVEHLRVVFPTMVQIGTYAKIGITTDPETGEEKGSVLVQYMAAHHRLDPNFDGKVKPEHRQAVDTLATTDVYKSMGTNAAGFVLPGDGLPIEQLLPLARVISSNTTLTQYSKDDVEALGYVKIDILGLRALQTLNGCLTRIGRLPNEWDWIPNDDQQACALLRSGHCVGVFQYEGFSSQRGGREMWIRTTLDAILGLALYRPALMNGGQKDLFLRNRKGRKKDQQRLARLFDPILADTVGVPIFQEQIMEILKAIGMAYRDYNDLMTAIKASNAAIHNAGETFKRLRPLFYDLCEDRGLTPTEADEVWHAVVGFTEYGFNRAHATSYGLMSYRSAYLKAHHPLEYMASLLDVWAGEKKEPLYVREARSMGITIVRPDVNVSGVSWDVENGRRNALRKGLVSLPGIGASVAESIVLARPAGGFADVQDFIDRTPNRPVTGGAKWKQSGELVGVCRTLMEAGAFRSLDAGGTP